MSGVQLRVIKPVGEYGQTYENVAYTADPADPEQPVAHQRHPVNNNSDPHAGRHNNAHTNDQGAYEVYTVSEKEKDHWSPQGNAREADDGEDEEEDGEPNCCLKKIQAIQTSVDDFFSRNKQLFYNIFLAVLAILYAVYFGFAMNYSFGDEGSVRLLWVTCLVVVCLIIWLLVTHLGPRVSKSSGSCMDKIRPHTEKISWILVGLIYAAVILFVIIDVTVISRTPYNLVSGCGIIIYVLLFFIFSYSPAKVKWRPVVWGLALQFVFALIILRWRGGYMAFEWLGERVSEFLAYTDAGSIFVFGEKYTDHFFAFKILPTVIFFSTVISVLYYLGVMQAVIRKVAWVMQFFMGTTAAESLNAAGNIFIGQSEAPLLIRPLIHNMTRSELHAVMTGGFATIAGTVLAAYILFGVPANHLLSASVMSAPAALAMAKLFYPETQKSKTTAKDVAHMEKSKERNVIEAASAGASASISLVANIAVNLIAFLAMLAFINATLKWFGERVGLEPENGYSYLSFEFICSYLMWPFALIMGVNVADCRRVAELIGIKTFLNEFVAFEKLGELIDNKKNFTACMAINGTTFEYLRDDLIVKLPNNTEYVLEKGFITQRSEVIATYALCGFANLGSIGIMLGALGAMAPSRKQDLASIALRAMIAGNVACFMTACIAGLLYQPEQSLGFNS